VTAANTGDTTMFAAVVDDVPPIRTPSGRRRRRPARLGRHRWKIERRCAGSSCWRRLGVRWDRDAGRWFAFVLVACAVVCFNRR
jgi:hypothetical protein